MLQRNDVKIGGTYCLSLLRHWGKYLRELLEFSLTLVSRTESLPAEETLEAMEATETEAAFVNFTVSLG